MNNPHRLSLAATLMAMLSLVLLAGCVPVPLPLPPANEIRYVPAKHFPRNIDEKSEFLFKVGEATRKDVLLALGEPDFVEDGEQTFIYEGEVTPGGKVWTMLLVSPIMPGVGSWFPYEYDRYQLTIRFNELGVVESRLFKRFESP